MGFDTFRAENDGVEPIEEERDMFMVAYIRTWIPYVVLYVGRIGSLRHIDLILMSRRHIRYGDFAS